MDKNPVSERIKILLDKYAKGNKAAMGRMLGISGQAIADLIEGQKGGPSFSVIQKMLSIFSEISPQWLIFGEGPMIISEKFDYSPSRQVSPPSPEDLEHLIEQIFATQLERAQVDGQIASGRARQLAALNLQEQALQSRLHSLREEGKFARERSKQSEDSALHLGTLHNTYLSVQGEYSSVLRARVELQEIHARANQKASSTLYRVQGEADISKPFGGLLSYRLGISESSAMQLVAAGRIRTVDLEGSTQVTEQSVREFLGEA